MIVKLIFGRIGKCLFNELNDLFQYDHHSHSSNIISKRQILKKSTHRYREANTRLDIQIL